MPLNTVVIYQIQNYPEGKEEELNKIGNPISINLSLGGLQLSTNQKLPVNTYLKINLSIDKIDLPLIIFGRVVWSGDLPGKDRYKIGVKFVDFNDEQDIKLLDYFINKNN